MRRRAVLIIGLVLTLATTACDATLTHDDRITITAPSEGATVRLPVELDWSARDVTVTDPGDPDSGGVYFAAFLDRPPLGPGQALVELVERECAEANNGCATRRYFEQRGVYITDQPGLRITSVPKGSEHREDAYLHTVTIVLMDSDHRRVGEAAWSRTFRVTSG